MPPTVSDEEKCAHQLLALTVELRHPQHLAITTAHGLNILSPIYLNRPFTVCTQPLHF